QRCPKSSSSGAGDDADGEALCAVDHQDEIVGIGGVDRLDRGVGDGIERSAVFVLVMDRKSPPFQETGDREPEVPGVRFDGNLVEAVRSDLPVASLALHAVELARDHPVLALDAPTPEAIASHVVAAAMRTGHLDSGHVRSPAME